MPALFCIGLTAHSQNVRLYDSLTQQLENVKDQQEKVDILNRLAWEYLDFNDSISVIHASDGFELAKKISYLAGMKYSLILIGQGTLSSGRFDQAFQSFRKSQQIKVENGEEIDAYNYFALGSAFDQIGQYDSAYKYYDHSISISKLAGLNWRLGQTYIKYGSSRVTLGYVDQALEWLSKAEALKDGLPLTFESYLYPALARVYLEKKDLANAEKYQQLCNNIPKSSLTLEGQATILINQCKWFLTRGNTRLALQAGLKTIEVLKRLGDNTTTVEAYLNLGHVYYELRENLAAINYCEQALKMSERFGSKPLTAKALNQLGWYHHDLWQNDVALDFAVRSMNLYRQLGNKAGESDNFNLMGLIYTDQKKYNEALAAYDSALNIQRMLHDLSKSDILYNMSILYEDKKEFQKGVDLLRTVLSIDKNLKDEQAIAKDYLSIGQLQIKQQLLDSAEHNLLLSIATAKKIGSKELQVEILKKLAMLNEKRKNFEAAYRYAQSINVLKDSIEREMSPLQVDEMRAFFLAESKEREIELLNNRVALNKSRMDLQELTIRDQSRVIFAAILLIVLIAIFLFYYYRSSQKLAVARDRLTELNITLIDKIQEEKHLIDQLRVSREQALEASRTKSEFVANISHELRTPLNAVIGFAEILKEQITNPSHSEFLRHILSGGRSLLSIVNDVLDLSKIEFGKFDLSYSYINIADIVSDMKSLFLLTAREKNIDFLTIVQDSFPPQIYVDDVRLRQIIINLLSNAFKFTESGVVVLAITAILKDGQAEVKVSVKDTGIGISQENRELIFKAFSQVDQRNVRKYGGTGLGLTITQKLTTAMGGVITLESTPGVGSEFVVRLPGIKYQLTESNSSAEIAQENRVVT